MKKGKRTKKTVCFLLGLPGGWIDGRRASSLLIGPNKTGTGTLARVEFQGFGAGGREPVPVLLGVLRQLVLVLLGSASALAADELVDTERKDGPIAQLQATGIFFECKRLRGLDSVGGSVDPREVTDDGQVEYVRLGRIRDSSGELRPLPEEVFDILPQFPKLRAIHIESFLLDPEKLKRLKEIPNLQRFMVHLSFRDQRKSFNKPEDLDFLAELPGLEQLCLTSSDLTDEMIVKLLPLKSLKVLRLTWNYKLTHAVLPILDQLPALEHVDMHYTGFAPPPMVARRFAERLKSFSYSAPTLPGEENFTLDDFREIVTLPRHTWSYPHRTDAPLAGIVALLPGPVTHLSTASWRQEIKLGGTDAAGEKFSLSISRPLADADLETAGRMTELRSLSVTVDAHEGLRRLTELGKLEFLKISSSRKLTSHSLAALSKMPSLRRVELRGLDFDADSLAWIRTATRLEHLTLLDGTISGDALADLVHARNLHSLELGNQDIYGTVQGVSLTRPTRPVEIDNIKRLTLVSTELTVEQSEVLGRFRSLESLELTAPVTDAHLRCLMPLERLSGLTVKLTTTREGERNVPAGKITPHGIQQLRSVKTPIYLQVPISDSELEEAMAHQFGWRFYGCSSGCCDTTPIRGTEWTVDAGRLKPIVQEARSLSEAVEGSQAVRLRGPMRVERLVLDRKTLPPEAGVLCLTDCHIGELCFQDWLPGSIRIWGDSHVARIVVANVPEDARTALRYYFLDGVTTLTVPESNRLSRIGVTQCAALESLRLDGFYPNLEQLELRGVERLRYLAVPYRGDAPRLEYPADAHWAKRLVSLRLLKAPGTAIGNKPVVNKPVVGKPETHAKATGEAPRFPPSVVEVDLRDTPIGDDWLRHLADLRHLKIVRIGECRNLTEEGKAAFRKLRPDVLLDEQTVHRPGAP